jgi:hypothetical protein
VHAIVALVYLSRWLKEPRAAVGNFPTGA